MDADRLVAEEDAGWRELHEALDRVPVERFDEPGVTPDGWSAKDVMFHVGAWCAYCCGVLERIRMGTYAPTDLGDQRVDVMNREWFEASRGLDADTVRVELHSARTRMLQAWGAFEEIPQVAWEWFEESGALHYAEHLRDLRAWLGESAR